MDIVYAKPLDVAQISSLFKEVVTALPFYNKIAKHNEIKKYTPKKILELIRKDRYSVLIAKNGKKVVGFCFNYFDNYTIWIDWVGIDKKLRNSGIGTLLVKRVITDAKKRRAHKVWCDTRSNNNSSKNLAKKLGFREIIELKNHWYGQDFILWERPV
jgi:ribosomal protein S18 acetylase RimI-like enzyme